MNHKTQNFNKDFNLMPTINQNRDVEITRQTRNHTDSQRKNATATKEGVVVNSFYKEPKNSFNINEVYDSLVISDNAKMPEKLKENKTTKDKSLTPIALVAVGVMASIALVSALVRRSAGINLNIEAAKRTDHLTRNISITNESMQGIYQMVQCSNKKTIYAGIGVITMGAMAFMGKMFIDGFKDIWVKRREADIQKNLQENLVAVETQSFSGKIQIMRGMMSEKAREFSDYLCLEEKTPITFKKIMSNPRTYFSGNKTSKTEFATQNDEKKSNVKYFALGALTIGAIAGLGFLSLKNLSKSKEHLEKYIKQTQNEISEIIKNSSEKTKKTDKIELKNKVQSIDSKPNDIRKDFAKLNWENAGEKESFINELVFNQEKSTTKAHETMAGSGIPKPSFNSYVSDYRAFFYNYLLDTENPQFKMLFLGMTGLTAFSYGGKVLGEAVKDVQVKKMNAQTELDLQKRLVATELRNFKAKKDAAIDPLCDEFYTQLQKGKPKSELKTIAENILFEVKNGPPFVYS